MPTGRERLARIAAERHCWKDGPEEIVQEGGEEGQWWTRLRPVGSTCLLPDGHPGEHRFTPDDQLVIQFAPKEEAGGG
jgi:hypothetical protein